MKCLVLGVSLLALVLSTAPPSWAADASADAQFKALYTREWTWRQAQRLEDGEDDDVDVIASTLPKVDATAQAERLAYWTQVMTALDHIPVASLSDPEQVNYQVYRAQIAVLINDQKVRDYEKPLTADTGFWSNPASTADGEFKTQADYEHYISQLKDLPRYFSEETVNMRSGLARGFTPPKVTLTGREVGIAAIADAKTPQATVYYKPFLTMPAVITAAEQARLRAEGAAVIASDVIPAHKTLLAFFRDDYMPHARESLGADKLPDGRAYYQSKLTEFATTDMTPERIHQLGLDEMAKIHTEMLAAMKAAGFRGDLPAFLQFLRTDPQFYAKTPEELLMRTAYVAKSFDGVAGKYFGYLPRARFAIKPVPAEEAPFYTSGRGGPGVYLVNTYDLPSRGLYSMPALTLHESAPGHAFQMPIALEHKDLPAFRRVYISAYGEGWALYCERLGTEMGMYRTPYETFGMLSYQAWRAARLVVDTGIHTQNWTREQAQAYLHANTALSNHEIETEVDRYISWPGQAVSYYLGEAAIWKGRHKAEAALGPKFNIRAFHDSVLELGSVPLPVLEAHIDHFIANGGKGPYPDME